MLLWYARFTLAAWRSLRQLQGLLRLKRRRLLRAAVQGWRATRLFVMRCQQWLPSQHALQAPAGDILLRLRRLLVCVRLLRPCWLGMSEAAKHPGGTLL